MPSPFFVLLKKKHNVPKVTSYTGTEETEELQLLVASGDQTAYRKREKELLEEGFKFRLTKGTVYEIRDEGERMDVRVAVQVKGYSLTWYFWAPGGMDQYPQTFRDKLYNAAAAAHKKVENGCDLYYRGSNAVHIKMMHDLEKESDHNHNHYRLKDNKPYTPTDFNQHMKALAESEIHQEFFEEGEVDKLCADFSEFYKKWTAKQEGELSLEDQYFASETQRLEAADVIELSLFGTQQEPCRINASELKVDYELARKEIERAVKEGGSLESLGILLTKIDKQYEALLAYRQIGGSRGLNSAIASSRQVKGSKNPVITANMGMDDKIAEVPEVPDWALSVKTAVEVSKAFMIKDAKKRIDPSEELILPTLGKTTVVSEERELISTKVEVPEVDIVDKPPGKMLVGGHRSTFISALEKENLSAKKVVDVGLQSLTISN